MPLILKLLTILCFAGVLFPVFAAIPGGSFGVNGQQVSYEEFWRLGGGPVFVLAGIVLPISGYTFLKRKSWGRYLFVGFFVSSIIAVLILSQFLPVYKISFADVIQYVIFIILLILYLFFDKSVKEYFNQENVLPNQALDGTA